MYGEQTAEYALCFSAIAPAIIEIHVLWLDEDCILSCYNLLAKGYYM